MPAKKTAKRPAKKATKRPAKKAAKRSTGATKRAAKSKKGTKRSARARRSPPDKGDARAPARPAARGVVRTRGERRGGAVEKRPTGEAELEADHAEANTPIDVRTRKPVEGGRRGRVEGRQDDRTANGLAGRQHLSDNYERNPDDPMS